MSRAELLWVNVRIAGLTVARHRWQIALFGLSVLARPTLNEIRKYDPLSDDKAVVLAARLAGYPDVPKFVAEQAIITDRLETQLVFLQERRSFLRLRKVL